MNVSLSKNEQLILFVVVFAIIAVAGTILFLMPKFEQIGASNTVYNQKRTELDTLSTDFGLEKFKEVEANINKAREEGVEAAKPFYGRDFTSYDADRMIRDILAERNLLLDNLAINRMGLYDMRLSIHRPDVLVSEIGDEARVTLGNTGGDETAPTPENAEETEENIEAMRAFMATTTRARALNFYEAHQNNLSLVRATREFLERDSETLHMQSVRFEIQLTPEEAFDLSMHIYQLHELKDESGELMFGTTYINRLEIMQSSTMLAGDVREGANPYSIEVFFFIAPDLETFVPRYEEMFFKR
jgi:hypothetical protein